MTKGHVCWRALLAAFPYTTPILAGFAFLGFAYGVYMNVMEFPFYYPFLLALVIFGGSLEFVAVSLLLAPFAPLATFLLALLIQARHLFYGFRSSIHTAVLAGSGFSSSTVFAMRRFPLSSRRNGACQKMWTGVGSCSGLPGSMRGTGCSAPCLVAWSAACCRLLRRGLASS